MEFNLQELKYQRLRKNLTQKDVADILGISAGTYNQKEKGKIKISVKELQLIANVLDIKDINIFFIYKIPECQ